VAEVCVRVFDPQVLFPRYVTDSPYGIRVNVPNATYWHTSPEMKVRFDINSMGIRSDREYTFEKPAGTIRIIGVGDSFTQGYEVDLHETYLYRLEELLLAKGYPVEVINLGVSGYGNAEELILLTEFGFRFAPDFVVVGYFQNDLDDNIRSRLYAISGEGGLVRDAESYLPAIALRNKLYSFGLYRWLAENSQLCSMARERLAQIVKRRLIEETSPGDAQQGQHRAVDRAEYSRRLAARLLDEIKRHCDDHGAKFVLLDIPVYTRDASNLPVELLLDVREEEIVRPLARLRADGPDAYLYRQKGHFHWTPRGHEIAAELLADKLSTMLTASAPGVE